MRFPLSGLVLVFVICIWLLAAWPLGAVAALASTTSGIRVQGPNVPPQLIFACCDRGVDQMQSLFADSRIITNLKQLQAGVAVAITDFSPERAELVRRLNQARVPAIAWMLLSKEQGYYFNAENAPAAAPRFACFDAWSRHQGLRWDAVGLDIEPNFAELTALDGHRWRLLTTLFWRAVDRQSVVRARQSYSALIANMRSRGYFVQTYQMPFILAERKAHSSLLDRILDTVDVRGDQEAPMLYTSFARPIGAAMIWNLGRDAQAISIGSTDGDPSAKPAPLTWSEFSRDLIVAHHFTQYIGVYDLEGCVRQGFLPRLMTMDWGQSVTIPADALHRADLLRSVLWLVLWTSSHLPYLIALFLLGIATIVLRWRLRKMEKNQSM